MARLPHPGGDSGNWGSILNNFLSQVHASDGTLKTDSVTSDAIAPDAVTIDALAPALQSKIDNPSIPDASSSTKGKLQLTGDLAGTASSPSVVRLSGVSISGTPSSGDVLTASGSTTASWTPTNVGAAGKVLMGATTKESLRSIIGGPIDLRDWDEIRNGLWKRALCAYTSGSQTMVNNTFPFTADDVGKIIISEPSGGNPRWMATILSVSEFGVATLDTAAVVTQSNAPTSFGFDITDALNAALLEIAGNSAAGAYPASVVSTSGVTPREVYLPGWYRCRQIVVPGSITLRGAGWGNYNLGYESTMGTVLHQLPASDCDFLVFTHYWGNPEDGYCWIGPVGVTDLQLEGPELNVHGVSDPSVGSGFSFRAADGTSLIPQDGCEFRWIHVTNFPEHGFNIPAGGVPLTIDSCRAFYNSGYGWNYEAVNYARTQMVHLLNCSCDGNILGGARFKGAGPYGSILVTSFKSEATSAAMFEAHSEFDPGMDTQMSALIFDDCDRTAVAINGVSHIYANATKATGPTILIRSTSDMVPQISFNGIATRYVGGEPGEEDAVTLRDSVSGVDVPRVSASGWYLYGYVDGAFRPNRGVTETDEATLYLKTLRNPNIWGSLYDNDGNRIIGFNAIANAVNYVQVSNRAAGVGDPTLAARGSDTNISLNLVSQGTGDVKKNGIPIATTTGVETFTYKTLTAPQIDSVVDSDGHTVLEFGSSPSAVDYLAIYNQVASSGGPMIRSFGSTNTPITLRPRGNSAVRLSGDASQTTMTLSASSSATDVSMDLTTKGAGVVKANGLQVVTQDGALGTPSSVTLTNATGLPVSGITASTSTALGVGSVELGHATDTTVSRSAAGVVAVEGFDVVTKTVILLTSTVTLASVGAREYIYLLGSGAVPTLPTAVGNTSLYYLKNTHTTGISLATTSSQTIDDGASPLVIQPNECFTLVSDNANWRIL